MGSRLSKAYLLTKVLTANRQEVIVYLYEGAIGYLHRAASSLREGHLDVASRAIDRTVSILVELSGSLNYATGGRLALRLDGIYNYLIETLCLAGGEGNIEAVEACESILVVLHDAWSQAAQMEGAQAPRDETRLQVSA